MKINFLLDAINKIEQLQEQQSIAIAMLQGYILGSKNRQEEQPGSNYSPTNYTSAVLERGDEVKKYKGKTIRRKADGRWWTRYTVNGKVHAVYGKTQDECLRKLKEALALVEKGATKVQKTINVGDWIQKWMELYKRPNVKKTTFDKMQLDLTATQSIWKIPLKKLTALDLQTVLNSVKQGRKREKIYVMLKDAFTRAYKNRLVDNLLFEAVDKPKFDKKKSRSLTKDEEILFVEECRKTNQGDLFLLCLYQGLRLGEAVALTYDDVDFERNVITINKSVDENNTLTKTKTVTSNRIIPLFQRTRDLLNINGKGKVFSYNRKVYQNRMLLICKKLGLQGISIHSLRHTFATRCSEAGVAPKVVQKWLGHSTVNMTLSVYTHVNNDFEQEMTSKVDTFFDTFFDTL